MERDEAYQLGFVAVDLVDERTLVLEARNVTSAEYLYRLQARCGAGDVPLDLDKDGYPDDIDVNNLGLEYTNGAYNVYYDPQIRNDGRGGGVNY